MNRSCILNKHFIIMLNYMSMKNIIIITGFKNILIQTIFKKKKLFKSDSCSYLLFFLILTHIIKKTLSLVTN